MLHILFLILKIIGIILLLILGITLTIIAVILFVPIRYRAKVETADGVKDLRVEAKVTWLLHLISARVVYKSGELDWKARIFWKKMQENIDRPEKKGHEKTTAYEETNMENAVDSQEIESEKEVHEKPESEPSVKTEKPQLEEKKEKASKQKVSWFQKIKCTIIKIYDKIKKIKEYITNDTNLKAILRIKNELIYFLKKIKPKKIKGFIRFGMEDPYNTGRVLAVLSVLYPFYGEHFEIYPEFDKEIIEGNIYLKGRIRLIYLIIAACKICLDRNVKQAYKNIELLKE